MKTKKVVSAVLTATLLIFALLVSSCMDLAGEMAKNDAEDNYQVIQGKGLVRFKISKEGTARTVFPDTDISKMHFAFIFHDKNGVNPDIPFPTNGTDTVQLTGVNAVTNGGTAAFSIDEGTYFVTINAYNSSGVNSANLISGVTVKNTGDAGYTVNGSTCNIAATLKGEITKTPSPKQGLFTYNITLPSLPTNSNTAIEKFVKNAHTLDVFPYPYTGVGDTSAIGGPINLLTPGNTANTTGISINSGFYVIRVVCKADYCQDRVVTEVMHIYDNLTTNFEESVPAFAQNKFTVKFSLNGVTDNTGFMDTYGEQEVENADPAVRPYASGDFVDPEDITSMQDFVGWFNASGGTTPWNFTNKIYTDDVTIYAHWESAAGFGDVDISIVFTTPSVTADLDYIISDGSGNNPTTLTFDDLYGTYTISITLTDAKPGSVWRLGDDTIITPASGDTLTISSSTTWLKKLTLGSNNYIYVTGEDDDDQPFTAKVTITISPKS